METKVIKRQIFWEYLILYTIDAFAACIIAALARMFALSTGLDAFTAGCVFIIALLLLFVAFGFIQIVIRDTAAWISKRPYFKKAVTNFEYKRYMWTCNKVFFPDASFFQRLSLYLEMMKEDKGAKIQRVDNIEEYLKGQEA